MQNRQPPPSSDERACEWLYHAARQYSNEYDTYGEVPDEDGRIEHDGNRLTITFHDGKRYVFVTETDVRGTDRREDGREMR